MAEEKLTSTQITGKEFGRRFRKALSVPFLLKQVCSTNVCDFVTSYASSLGCSDKSFFFPLLTCAAACMGTDCYIELSNLWHEPPIIWTLVITPRSLLRMDVAEHLKQELLKVQNEMWLLNQQEDTKDHLKKFIFDMFTIDQLQDMLKLSNGHGFGIYNSIRSLHKCMMLPEDTDIMHRLHYGLGWFTDSRATKCTLSKTRMNISVLSTPSVVQQTLASAPNFSELFYQCFLTACAEENHVKFNQLSVSPETEKLREIFISLMKLHSSGPIVYKLSQEGAEKFGQIHDELTHKAKQMTRKNVEHKVFQPALSYLGRLSCVLHVLDNVIESINYKVPISRLTWNTEISAATVWFARELLGHIVEQRHALMEQTTFVSAQKVPRTSAINLVEGQSPRPVTGQRSPQSNITGQRTPQPNIAGQRTPQSNFNTPSPRVNSRLSPAQAGVQNTAVNVQKSCSIVNVRRNIMNNIVHRPSNNQFDALRNQNVNNTPTPCISTVTSAGIPVNTAVAGSNSNANFNLPSSLSISVSAESLGSQPVLLSRAPSVSVLDISDDDFVKSHKSSVRKVLVHNVSPITPSRCVQLKLIFDPTATDTAQKYSLSFARTFLKKLEKMGFGVCDGLKNGNLRQFVFKKKKFSALSDLQIKRLSDLAVNEREYNKCFNTAPRKTAQNGNVVCLE